MPQKTLSAGGGKGPLLAARFPSEQVSRVLELASAAGLTKSQFVRAAVADAIERALAEGDDVDG